jgi:hypothetical protein
MIEDLKKLGTKGMYLNIIKAIVDISLYLKDHKDPTKKNLRYDKYFRQCSRI